ncbi:hypothetical protein NQ318_003155 [Aromia moschata]|uniref:Uncharacterized protein n=1 Tax=Aromia moschata TaxID=1265417 RepID=A0AAV8YUL2_9CUCU|nr:hypothetical protein NQ318_003155 [Aromia moschata]
MDTLELWFSSNEIKKWLSDYAKKLKSNKNRQQENRIKKTFFTKKVEISDCFVGFFISAVNIRIKNKKYYIYWGKRSFLNDEYMMVGINT